MKSLTVCQITSRAHPEFHWAIDAIKGQLAQDEVDVTEFMLIDLNKNPQDFAIGISFYPPKPNVWQGEHRKTPVDWWAKSNAINTALCHCKTEWILFLDDRCVPQPGFMAAAKSAMNGNYIMAGAYEKRHSMTVENGIIKNAGIITAHDHRQGSPAACHGEWLFGCVTLAPLEWWLDINGSPERCDGLSFEDVITGIVFSNAGRPIKYDRRAMIVEDRSHEFIGTPMRRESKEKHPHDHNDKAHTLLRWARAGATRSDNDFDIRQMRAAVLRGEGFPPVLDVDAKDWFDGQDLKEMR